MRVGVLGGGVLKSNFKLRETVGCARDFGIASEISGANLAYTFARAAIRTVCHSELADTVGS